MRSELYQEYLQVIGKLKDIFGLSIDVDHPDIHTFYKDKRPLFKLFFGMFEKDENPSIVVSFHIELFHPEAINWFVNIYKIHPQITMHDSYIEDSAGETYLGEDAMALKETYMAQEILGTWLDNSTREEMEDFVDAGVFGRDRDPTKSFDSHKERHQAIIEFERLRKPGDDEETH